MCQVCYSFIGTIAIGFTQRTQTISEADVPSGQDLLQIIIPVAIERISGRTHTVIFRLIESTSQAIVESPLTINPLFDAIFGFRSNPEGPLEVRLSITSGVSEIPSLLVNIRNDFVIEEEECFTIRTIVPDGSQFTCNSGAGATNFFCDHTICIEDDDGKYFIFLVCKTFVVLHFIPS